MSASCNTLLRGFRWIDVGGQHGVWMGRLPPGLCWCSAQFDAFWAFHPEKFHEVRMFGRRVVVPRWSEAYGQDYWYSGTLHRAVPIPHSLAPLLAWSKIEVDERLNGVLVNWYDGSLGHRIGPHRDAEKELVVGAPIITISFGETRTFRLRRWKGARRMTSRWPTTACSSCPTRPTSPSHTRCPPPSNARDDASP